MFNSDHQSYYGGMSPRISFSNDLMDPNQMIKRERSPAPPPDASDFEFSVSGYNMIAADEIFSKGRLMPLKENCTSQLQRMTLRDELRIDDGGDSSDNAVPQRPPRGPMRWRELLGLRKSGHAILGRKHDKAVVEGSPLGPRSGLGNSTTANVSAPKKASSSLVITNQILFTRSIVFSIILCDTLLQISRSLVSSLGFYGFDVCSL